MSQITIHDILAQFRDKRFTSGIIISTTDRWGSNAEKSLANRDAPGDDDTADLQLSDLAFPATTSVGIQDLLKDDSNQLNVDDAAQSPGKRPNPRQRQRHRRLFGGLGPHAYLDAKNISNTLRTSAHRI